MVASVLVHALAVAALLCAVAPPAHALTCGPGFLYYKSNRYGEGCYRCDSGDYQDATNHKLTSCKECPTGTAQPDRQQSSCDNCNDGDYQDQKGRSSCKECDYGKYTPDDGAAYTTCLSCQAGYYQDSKGRNDCKICDNGQYSGSSASRYCTDCPFGKFSLNNNQPYSVCTSCQPGYHQDQTRQTSCDVCDNGKYSKDPATKDCLTCSAGYFTANDGQPHSSCDFCLEGYAQNTPGQTSCYLCDAGTYAEGTANTACKTCGQGRYTPDDDQPHASCEVCEQGEYQPQSTATACLTCNPGQHQDERGQGACKSCTLGVNYQSSGGQAFCDPVTPGGCATGFRYTAPTLSSDRQCTICAAGSVQPAELGHTQTTCQSCSLGATFQNEAGKATCISTKTCAVGFGVSTPATLSSDNICSECVLGVSYSDVNDKTACKTGAVCVAGQQAVLDTVDTTHDWVCEACPANTYQPTKPSPLARCLAATTCIGREEDVKTLTTTSDRECMPVDDCTDGSYSGGNCVCLPECSSCSFQPSFTPSTVAVRLIKRNQQANRFDSLGPCITGLQGTENQLIDQCANTCYNNVNCIAFSIYIAGTNKGRCCPFSFVSTTEGYQSMPDGLFVALNPCDTCSENSYKINGRCRLLDTPPVVTGIPSKIVLPDTAPTSIDIASFSVSTNDGPVTWSVGVDNLSPSDAFTIAADGTLKYTRRIRFGGSGTVTVTVKDSRTSCVFKDANNQVQNVAGPCVTTFSVPLSVVFFQNCPTDQFQSVEPSVNSVEVNWDPPTIPTGFASLGITFGSNKSPGDLFARGTHSVVYESEPLAAQQKLTCTFSVVVEQGFDVEVASVTHAFTSSAVTDVLIDQQQPGGAGPKFPAFEGDITQGLIVNMRAPAKKPFSVFLPDAFEGQVAVLMQYCYSGTFPLPIDDTFLQNPCEAVIGGINPVSVNVPLSATCIATPDARCLRVKAQTTSPVVDDFQFESLRVKFAVDFGGNTPARRERRDLPGSQVYQPVTPSVVQMQFTNDTLSQDPGPILSLDDRQPPVWIGCPTTQTVTAAANALTATATWNEPQAVDNIAVVGTPTSTHSPGDSFSVIDSPHTVVYTATDGFQSSTCTFQVVVNYPAVAIPITVAVDDKFQQAISPSPILGITTTTETFFDSVNAAPSSFTANLALGNQLVVTYQPAPGDRLVLANTPGVLKAQLVVSFRWLVGSPSTQQFTPDTDVTATYQFVGLKVATTGGSGALPATGQIRFQTLHVVVDPDDGVVDLQGVGAPIPLGFAFDHLKVTLSYPGGRAGSTAGLQTFVVTASSFAGFRLTYPHMSSDPTARPLSLLIEDSEPPVFLQWPEFPQPIPTDLDKNYASVTWPTPVASDNRADGLTVVASPPSGSQFEMREEPHVITLTATDSNNNKAYQTFNFTVVDQQPPKLVCPPGAAVFNVSSTSNLYEVEPSYWMPLSMEDNSGVAPVLVNPAVETATFGLGEHDILVVVEDAAGLNANCTVSLTVQDTIAPVLKCPVLNPITQTKPAGANVAWTIFSAKDNDIVTNLTFSHASGDLFAVGTTQVTMTAMDFSQNEASCTFDVVVKAEVTAKSSAGNSTAPMAAGAAAGFVLILVLIALIMYRRAQIANRRPVDFEKMFEFLGAMQDSENGPRIPREIKRDCVKILQELGKGAFGIVAKGMLKELLTAPGYLVAVKQLHEQAGGTEKTELLEEAAVMAQFSHPNVVALIGVVTAGAPVMVILEYMEHGALQSYIADNDVDEEQLSRFALQCARGLEHIHAKGFVHRDVAARNVLLSSELVCKIADFGLARDEGDDTYYRSRGGQLPVRWTAPEALEGRKFDETTDVWSYGILVFELFTKGATPYVGMTNNKVWVQVQNGFRLEQPDSCPDEVFTVVSECWAATPADRPRFASIVKSLEAFLPPDEKETGGYLDVQPDATLEKGSRLSIFRRLSSSKMSTSKPSSKASTLSSKTSTLSGKTSAPSSKSSTLSSSGAEHIELAAIKENPINSMDRASFGFDEAPVTLTKSAQPNAAAASRSGQTVTHKDVGSRVRVEGYECLGTLLFFGEHALRGGARAGVALDEPVGLNNGTISDVKYFECEPKHGVLCVPKKVSLA